jgi:uncharacterized protein YrrD
MDIPVNARVICADGPFGRSTYVIIDPATERVTHLVVKGDKTPHTEHLVPIDQVVEATRDSIYLSCTRSRLATMDDFVEHEYVRMDVPSSKYRAGQYLMWPYAPVESEKAVVVEHKHIPPGELALHRGARVEATDGRVGRVDEFLVDDKSRRITHLVLREGHLWGQKDVAIPVSQIDRIEEDAVYLRLDKHSINALPSVPM